MRKTNLLTKERLDRHTIAMRVAKEFTDGMTVNLGIGIPTLCSNYVPEGCQVIYHSENGILNYGPLAPDGQEDMDYINAGLQFITLLPGASFFSSAEAFGMIRGGHVDVTVLGGLQVSVEGDLANWLIPARGVGNIGGGMDLAEGARRVIVAMEHMDREGNSKLVSVCSYPLTAKACVDLVVTDLGVFEVTQSGLLLTEIAPGWDPEEVQVLTDPELTISDSLQPVAL